MGIRFSKTFLIILVLLPCIALADSKDDVYKFFVDASFDLESRDEISAVLKKVSLKAYFYVDKDWYDSLENKREIEDILEILAHEFDETIYPQLTEAYGREWSPGIDNDPHITILFQQMKNDVAGYFNMGDEYEKVQNNRSNEREMIYLNTKNISYEIIKSYIAHEFTHLINFNRKDRLRGIEDEIWLNEMRAEIAPTIIGYDKDYQNSNLKQRVKSFIEGPHDSLVEWLAHKKDYGIISMFANYLIDYYGIDVLTNSMGLNKMGIVSLNQAIEDKDIDRTLAEVFINWTVAIFLNDCKYGIEYCYKNKDLDSIRITPSLIFLPSTQKTNVSLNYSIKPWSANWYRVLGGKGELSLSFNGENSAEFTVLYVLCQNSLFCEVHSLDLDSKQRGEVIINDFGTKHTSLTLIPLILSKETGFNGREPMYDFFLSVSLEDRSEEELIAQLLARIADLKAQIAVLQAKLATIKGTCAITQNLYLGMKDFQVSCLQQFLKSEGVYAQGLITGFFGPLTHQAVINFQDKYKEEILAPLGLNNGTGFVGNSTRQKINTLSQP